MSDAARLEAVARQLAYAVRHMGNKASPVALAYADAFYREFPHLTEEAVTGSAERRVYPRDWIAR